MDDEMSRKDGKWPLNENAETFIKIVFCYEDSFLSCKILLLGTNADVWP